MQLTTHLPLKGVLKLVRLSFHFMSQTTGGFATFHKAKTLKPSLIFFLSPRLSKKNIWLITIDLYCKVKLVELLNE